MSGIKRNLLPLATKMLDIFPVISIIGGRQVGKTTLAKLLKPEWKYFDLEQPEDFIRITTDPLHFFQQYPDQIIIDEAQLFPDLFKVLRGIIDAKRQIKGRFILTGSASVELLTQITETLAGRVGILELGSLKANEYYQKPLSSFYNLFQAKLHKDNIPLGQPPLSIAEMQYCWLKGGYPEPMLANDQLTYNLWLKNFVQTYINNDISRLYPKLNKQNFQRFTLMLGKLSGSIINKSNLARALEISEGTIKNYLEIAEGTFLWRNLLSYERNIVKTIIKMPKGYIRDPGLLHYFLRLDTIDSLMNDPIVGASFESFVIEEIIKGLQSLAITNWSAHYYRTKNGAEIDLILYGTFGILPIEIKYGVTVTRKQLVALESFIKEHHLSFGLVINQSKEAYWLTDLIAVIPVGCL